MSQSANLTDILGSSELQTLLTSFNQLDINNQGVVPITSIKQLLLSMNLTLWDDRILSKALITTQDISFDEFLVILNEVQALHSYQQYDNKNYRLTEFLKLLDDFRIKCEMEQRYNEAQKSYKKREQIIQKQVKRQQALTKQQHKIRLEYIKKIQKQKISKFNQAWKQFKTDFELSAQKALQDLKSKHLLQMQKQQSKIRKQVSLKPRQTKAIRQLRQQQKLLVKLKNYQQAQKINERWRKIQKQQIKQQQDWISKRVIQKTQNLRKRQQTILMAQLKKIQTSRDLQLKKQKLDGDKLVFKLKKLKDQIQQKQLVQNKQNINKLRQSMSTSRRSRKFRSLPKLFQKQHHLIPEYQRTMQTKSKVPFKIRVNSFNKPRLEENNVSLYDF